MTTKTSSPCRSSRRLHIAMHGCAWNEHTHTHRLTTLNVPAGDYDHHLRTSTDVDVHSVAGSVGIETYHECASFPRHHHQHTKHLQP